MTIAADRLEMSIDRDAKFLVGLAPRGRQFTFVLADKPLGDRPRAVILSCPERAAGMDQQKLKNAGISPVDQQACTSIRHRQSPSHLPRAAEDTTSTWQLAAGNLVTSPSPAF
ncbi:hypothetical protein AJ88_29135 [Mesorhizobium amorphae CCBAU 01583]|nr:hypothetical protein AJ88_29135 [Mesorhizobium amorphae CCBAU 01583]